MPIDPAVAATADAQVNAFITQTLNIQRDLVDSEPYLGQFPRFVQLPTTSDTPPTQEVPPNTTRTSPNRTEGWPTIKSRGYVPPATLRCGIAVSEYQYPTAEIPWGARTYHPGWFVTARLSDAGVVYERIFDGFGPETFATRWTAVS